MTSGRAAQIIAAIIALLILQAKDVWIAPGLLKKHNGLVRQEQNIKSQTKLFQKDYIDSQNMFSRFSCGLEQILSDYYWIKATTLGAVDIMLKYNISPDSKDAIALLEDAGLTDQQRKTLYELIRLSTNYDPQFVYAYEYGSLLLAWAGYTDFAVFILEEGVNKNPDSARLYNSLSFTHYFFMKDFEKGAFYAQKAYDAAKGGSYANPRLVAQAYAAGGDYDAAIRFLKELYDKPDSQMTKIQIESMIKYLTVERDIEFLQKALDRFIQKYDVKPMVLEGLSKTGIVTAIPTEPFGGKYVLNTETWKVENKPLNRYEHLLTIKQRDTRAGEVNLRAE